MSSVGEDTRPARRMVLVHAHPDDETIGTGVTMARYVNEGAGVTLLTCTRGEECEVLVTYDTNGGYGHPDHIQAHRVAMYGAALAAAAAFRPELGPVWDVPKIYWTAVPRSWIERGMKA